MLPTKPIEFVVEVKSLESLKTDGVGRIEAKGIQGKRWAVVMEGVGSAVVNVSEQLEADLSGVGTIEYVGSPQVRKSGKGLGQIKQRMTKPN